jgi:hypothetical protein
MQKKNNYPLLYLFGFSVLTILLLYLPFGRYILYPFIILGTWFHEMSHGLAAILLGGDFIRLEIFSNGSGLAVHSANLFLGGLGNAMVAAAGPLGPTIAGSVLLMSSKSEKASGIMLFVLGLFLILSVLIWVRSIFGVVFISIFGIIAIYSALKLKDKQRRFIIQFLAVQAFTSLYLSIGYLYSGGANVDGSSFASDTQVIAQNLLLPNWFWASLILMISAIMMIVSVRFVVRSNQTNQH